MAKLEGSMDDASKSRFSKTFSQDADRASKVRATTILKATSPSVSTTHFHDIAGCKADIETRCGDGQQGLIVDLGYTAASRDMMNRQRRVVVVGGHGGSEDQS